MTVSEDFLREFHSAHPGVTARAFARGDSYARLAALVPRDARVLDLACGDGALLEHVGARAVGIDLTHAELACARSTRITRARARAQALPFGMHAFDVVTCHLAFMLFDELATVVRELERVLVPGGEFVALLGGGPTAEGDDAFHRFLRLLPPRTAPRLGDPRARHEAGWRELMPRWNVRPFERWTLDLGGTFDQVWAFLGASYEVAPAHAGELRDALRAATAEWGDALPCTVVVYLARATTER